MQQWQSELSRATLYSSAPSEYNASSRRESKRRAEAPIQGRTNNYIVRQKQQIENAVTRLMRGRDLPVMVVVTTGGISNHESGGREGGGTGSFRWDTQTARRSAPRRQALLSRPHLPVRGDEV